MDRLKKWYEWLSNKGWLVLVTIVLSAGFMFILAPQMSQAFREATDPDIIALELTFSQERFATIVQTWVDNKGIGAVKAVRNITIQTDFIFPIVYAIAFTGAFAWAARRSEPDPGKRTLWLFALPFIAALSDYVENIFLIFALNSVKAVEDISDIPAGLVMGASLAAAVKFLLLIIAFVAFLVYLIKANRETWYRELSKGWIAGLFTLYVLLFLLYLFPLLGSQIKMGNFDILGLQFTFTLERFAPHIESLKANNPGVEGVDFVKNVIFGLDMVFPLVYSFAAASFVAWAARKTEPELTNKKLRFFMLPFLAALFDYAENILHVSLLGEVANGVAVNSLSRMLIFLASFFALIKWILLVASVVAGVVYLARWWRDAKDE